MLTIREVADELKLDTETVRQRILTGQLDAIKTGNGKTSPYRISREALNAYLERQAVTSS